MEVAEFLTPDGIVLDLRARDKPHLIAEIARNFARTGPALPPETIKAALLAREQLGSTGLGAGFALPHARIDGLGSYSGLFIRLTKPVEFAAIDSRPVSVLFALLIPAAASSHVAALAAISRKFRDADLVASLRKARNQTDAYGLLTGS